jgi:hypothetical protein
MIDSLKPKLYGTGLRITDSDPVLLDPVVFLPAVFNFLSESYLKSVISNAIIGNTNEIGRNRSGF